MKVVQVFANDSVGRAVDVVQSDCQEVRLLLIESLDDMQDLVAAGVGGEVVRSERHCGRQALAAAGPAGAFGRMLA